MGIGKLGDPQITFLRKFRFTLSGEHLDEDFNHSVTVDWLRQTIKLLAYEVYIDGKIPIWEWADAMQQRKHPDESLTLTAYNGMGTSIYRKKLEGLELIGRENKFDYSSSDAVFHEVTLQYNKVSDLQSVVKKDIKDEDLLPVNHLNAKIWVK